jgi:RNA polymerase sigma factor (sigma-70 family)
MSFSPGSARKEPLVSEKKASQDVSFVDFERLLWLVLSRLAKSGYVTPPNDAQDLIHDFYVDEWENLKRRYDPTLGSFANYLFSAFYRFARRRIVRLQSWHSRLVDTAELARRVDHTTEPREILERSEETKAIEERLSTIREALTALPTVQQAVLRDFLSSAREDTSERSLARRHGISRYRLREILVEALGRVASEQARRGAPGSSVRAASALWQDGRTVRDTAKILGLSVGKVRLARQRYVGTLLEAIREMQHPILEKRTTFVDTNALIALKKALLSPGDARLLASVSHDAEKILEALDDNDLEFSEPELKGLERHAEWVATVYRELAGHEKMPKGEQEIADAIATLRKDEEREIASAFVSLIETLPEEFRAWDEWFGGVPLASKQYQVEFRQKVVVAETLPYSEWLVTHGMTPATFVEAARGVELLVDRLLRMAAEPEQGLPSHGEVRRFLEGARQREAAGGSAFADINLTPTGSEELTHVPLGLLFAQVRGTPQCPMEAAEPLLRWMVGVARLKPFFFHGYEAEPLANEGIRLTQQPGQGDAELVLRWSRHAQNAEDQAIALSHQHMRSGFES